jgi:hypothetical protein
MKFPLNHFVPLLAIGLVAASANAQLWTKSHIGYAYPAGGQVGTSFEITIGGKGLNKVEAVQITGTGVNAEFVQHIGNYKNKLQEQIRVIKQQNSGNPKQIEKSKERRFGPVPDHEIFTRLEELSEKEFRLVASKFQRKERVQRNREIGELVVLRISIDPDARPGLRELRLVTRGGGVSNPVRFMINMLPEAREYEPNDLESPARSHMQIPFIMNGQIMPGDEDHFSFEATEGQKLVIHVKARELIPYLADAVPGWFQAVISVHDDNGREVAYADDFLFNPDPALLFEVPESGTYHVSIHDAIFRGREDFVYRIAVGEIPFVTGIYPLGAASGSDSVATTYGWNLGARGFAMHTGDRGGPTRKGFLKTKGTVSNYVRYAVGELAESIETEGNDEPAEADRMTVRSTMNGRINEPGDLDYYTFRVKKGQAVKISVHARRFYSPVDSLLRILDEDGQVVAWNDDMPRSGNITDRTGLLTHNSDSEVEFIASASGSYYAQVSDIQNNGGDTYGYRLTIDEPTPDFDLYVSPSALSVPSGGGAKAILHVKRKNGYTGPVDVKLASKSGGLQLSGGHIPEGCDSVPIVIRSQKQAKPGAFRLNIFGTAEINGEPVRKRAIPADDITQAFITHHLVESHYQTAYIIRNFRKHPKPVLKDGEITTICREEPATVQLDTRNLPAGTAYLIYELEEGPDGVELVTEKAFGGTKLAFTANDELQPGQQGNLVVGVYFQNLPKKNNKGQQPRKVALGVLPAIPYQTK